MSDENPDTDAALATPPPQPPPLYSDKTNGGIDFGNNNNSTTSDSGGGVAMSDVQQQRMLPRGAPIPHELGTTPSSSSPPVSPIGRRPPPPPTATTDVDPDPAATSSLFHHISNSLWPRGIGFSNRRVNGGKCACCCFHGGLQVTDATMQNIESPAKTTPPPGNSTSETEQQLVQNNNNNNNNNGEASSSPGGANRGATPLFLRQGANNVVTIPDTDFLGQKWRVKMSVGPQTNPRVCTVLQAGDGQLVGKAVVYRPTARHNRPHFEDDLSFVQTEIYDSHGIKRFEHWANKHTRVLSKERDFTPSSSSTESGSGYNESRFLLHYAGAHRDSMPAAVASELVHDCDMCYTGWTGFKQVPEDFTTEEQKLMMVWLISKFAGGI